MVMIPLEWLFTFAYMSMNIGDNLLFGQSCATKLSDGAR